MRRLHTQVPSVLWSPRVARALSSLGLVSALLAVETSVPTADEVDLLMSINRHRGDRVYGDYQIHEAIEHEFPKLQLDFFYLDGKKPAQPPLVFNAALMTAARTLLASGLTPVPLKPIDHAPVFAAVNYTSAGTGLILCGFDQPSPYSAYLTSFVQTVGTIPRGNTAVQPVHGGIGLLAGTWREAGVAMRTVKGRSSLVLVLGTGSAVRYLGGQVYLDDNRNGRSDLGEGKSEVKINIGAMTTATGPGGMWWIEQATQEAGEVQVTIDGAVIKRPFAAGKVNQMIEVRMPNPDDVATAKRLVSSVEKAEKGPEAALRKSQVVLLSQTRATDLDESLRTRVDALTVSVNDDFLETLRLVRSTLALDPVEFKAELKDIQRPWGNALTTWFKEWEMVYTLRRSANEVLARPAEEQAKHARPLLATVIKTRTQASDPDMRSFYTEIIDSLHKFEVKGK